MKYLILLLLLSCNDKTEQKNRLPLTDPIAEIDTDGYVISKYEDGDFAICYTVYKTESISISCVRK
jgi:hypothetical protein